MTAPLATLVVAWVLTYLVHSTVLVLAVWALARWLERHAELACRAWQLALFGGVLTATLQVAIGGPSAVRLGPAMPAPAVSDRVPVLPMSTDTGERTAMLPAARGGSMVDETGAVGGEIELDEHASVVTAGLRGVASAETPAPIATTRLAIVDDDHEAPLWQRAVAWMAVLAALSGLLSVVAAAVGLRRRIRGLTIVEHGELASMLDHLRARAGLRRKVTLAVAPAIDMPMATGLWDGRILVPPRVATALTAAEQETMLAHELAHVVRKDPLWRLAAVIVRRLLAWQPLNRVAADRLEQASEWACDDWAARTSGRPIALARCLTEVAGWVTSQHAPALGSAMSKVPSALHRRVVRLLDGLPPQDEYVGRLAGVAGIVMLSMVTWWAPGVSVASDPPATLLSDEDEFSATRTEYGSGEGLVHIEGVPVVALTVVPAITTVPEVVPASVVAPAPERTAAGDRKSKREVDKARRAARKAMRKAFRDARKEGRVGPSADEVETILGHTNAAEPTKGKRRPSDEAVEVRIASKDDEITVVIVDELGRTHVRRRIAAGDRRHAGSERGRGHDRSHGRGHDRGGAHGPGPERGGAFMGRDPEEMEAFIRDLKRRVEARARAGEARARAAEARARAQEARIRALAHEQARRAREDARELEQAIRAIQRRQREHRGRAAQPNAPAPPRAPMPSAPAAPQAPPAEPFGTYWISTPPPPPPPPADSDIHLMHDEGRLLP